MKIKTKDANLYNCEGFMTDMELVDKINHSFKKDTEFGMTLAGLIEVAPRDFFSTMGDGETMFTKSEVNRVIKYLDAFGLTLNQMVRANKSKRYRGEVRQIQVTNLEFTPPCIEQGREPTDAEVDEAFEEVKAFEKKVDAETATPAVI